MVMLRRLPGATGGTLVSRLEPSQPLLAGPRRTQGCATPTAVTVMVMAVAATEGVAAAVLAGTAELVIKFVGRLVGQPLAGRAGTRDHVVALLAPAVAAVELISALP